MSDLERLLLTAQQNRGARMALATVVTTWGSAPRPAGSHMLVLEDGSFEGSVSGGCVENAVLQEATKIFAGEERSRTLSYGTVNDNAWSAGLPCGGKIEVLLQPVCTAGFAPELFERIRMARENGRTIRLVTDARGQTREGLDSDGFVNLYEPPKRMLIIGAVQIAQSLAQLAKEVGFKVTVIDPRSAYLTPGRFPGVTHDTRWPDVALAALKPNPSTAVVTLTHDIKLDDPALSAALLTQAGYIAALGSRKSHAARLERLAGMGFDAAILRRIEGPAGMDIGAIGPAEIAVSILAGAIRQLSMKFAKAAAAARADCSSWPRIHPVVTPAAVFNLSA